MRPGNRTSQTPASGSGGGSRAHPGTTPPDRQEEIAVDARSGDIDGPGPPVPGPSEVLPLYTPAQAAELLAVRESWLRRRAAARTVPCTMLGKHLRFSHADVTAIAAAAARPAGPVPRRRAMPRRR